MSIYGKRITALSPLGVPGRPEGKEAQRLMINIELPLQIAGALIVGFLGTEDPIIPPAQIAQEGDGDILVVVQVVDANSAPVDLSGATETFLLVEKPDLTTAVYAAALTNGGADGRISYALDASDLDQSGFYQLQATFKVSSAPKSTVIGSFKVQENIPLPVI